MAAEQTLKTTLVVVITLITLTSANGVYEWMTSDNFDEIIDRMDAVNELNCEAKSREELLLPFGTVSNIVKTNKLRTSDFQKNYYSNRSSLLQLHATSLANAYKFSYLFQRLNQTWNFADQPSLFYYYLGLTADVTANLGFMNGSAVFFDNNNFYPNFLTQVSVNKTIPLFGPRSWRVDDYNDPANWLREPTNNTFAVTDYGAGPLRNYTLDAYKINGWYDPWLPHRQSDQDLTLTDEVTVGIRRAIRLGELDQTEGFKFFGPASPFLSAETDELPVQFTRPYFDCGRSNKWIVSATAPIYDRLPRYPYDPDVKGNFSAGIFDDIRKNRRVGVAVTDVDFLNIDINPCSRYPDDDGDNYLGGIDRCHKLSTICKPLNGFGFQRGGYICECRPNYRYPEYIQGPYLGVAIERATEEEHKAGFHCIKSEDLFVVPEYNSEVGDNSGIDRLPGSTSNRKKREAEVAHAEMSARFEDEDRKRRDVESITKYSDAKTRFIRRITPKDHTTIREAREYMLKKRRVANFDGIPSEFMDRMVERNSDLGMGYKGRQLVSKYKKAEEKKEAELDKKLNRKKRTAFSQMSYDRVAKIFTHKSQMTAGNCRGFSEEQWKLPGDAKFGVEKKLERLGRQGVRLADFLSSFLQNVDGEQSYGTLSGDSLLKEEQLYSEVLAVILAEPDVEGIGLLFDTDQYQTFPSLDFNTEDLRETLRLLLVRLYGDDLGGRDLQEEMDKVSSGGSYNVKVSKELFGPYAYQLVDKDSQRDSYHAVDRAGEKTLYTESTWYKDIKRRWSYNSEGLKSYTLNPWIRNDIFGTNIRKHEEYPLVYKSASYEAGVWSDPYFDCGGYIRDWILSYRIPFFGNTGYGSAVKFRGIVVVDVKLDLLDIEQCPSDFYASNAFMGTARCDYESTYCVPIENQGFQLHQGYRCNCKQGYEYPWKGANEYFYTGDLIEESRLRYLDNRTNRFDRLKCRMSSATQTSSMLLTVTLSIFFAFLMK